MSYLLEAAEAILDSYPGLGWHDCVRCDEETGEPLHPPLGRDRLRASLERQVVDALVYLAGRDESEGSAQVVAATASGVLARPVSFGAVVIAAEIARMQVIIRPASADIKRFASARRPLPLRVFSDVWRVPSNGERGE